MAEIARLQVRLARDRGADLPDHDAAGDVGDPHRDRQRKARRHPGRERRRHRVAGAGDVEHLRRLGREMVHAGAVEQRHAVLAAGHQHRAEAMRAPQMPCGGDDRGLVGDVHARRLGELAPVRLDQVGARIAAVVAALRIDDHAAAGRARGGDHRRGHIGRHHALAVIGDDGDRGRHHRVLHDAEQALGELRMDRRGDLAIGAQELLALGDVAGLHRGLAAALHQQPGLDIGLAADQPGEVRAGLVVAQHRDEGDGGAERREVAHDIAGATRHRHLARDGDDRDRRLLADPLDRPIDVAVEHRVADDEHAGAGEARDRGGERGMLVGDRRAGVHAAPVHARRHPVHAAAPNLPARRLQAAPVTRTGSRSGPPPAPRR